MFHAKQDSKRYRRVDRAGPLKAGLPYLPSCFLVADSPCLKVQSEPRFLSNSRSLALTFSPPAP